MGKHTKPLGEVLRRSRQGFFRRPLVLIIAFVVVFGLGEAVGNGTLSFRGGLGNNQAVSGLPEHLDYSSVNTVYTALRQNYDGKLTVPQMLDGLKEGLATATGDPYTEYFNAQQTKSFQAELNNSFSGVGAELGKDKDSNLIVVAPIAGFPAAKAGLKAQDIITDINGQTTTGMGIDEAVAKIKGQPGTTVTLKIVRAKSQTLSLTITRANIQVPSVDSKLLDQGIGYVTISSFADDTPAGIKQAADKLSQAHVKGIILDLRDNPGGLVDSAVSVASQWLPEGKTIMQEKRGGTTVVGTKRAVGGNELTGIPTVVLINGNSASAAEITAAALHDNGQAYLLGEKSYGKGVEQDVLPFPDGSELKVTAASWYRPNGQNINHQGITPDKVVKEGSNDSPTGSDAQKDAAIQFLSK